MAAKSIFNVHDMQLNRLTLSFPKWREKRYRYAFFNESLQFFRIAFILLIALYSVFGILDVMVISGYTDVFLIIRFGIVVPFMCAVFLMSFAKYFIRIWQLLIFLSVIIGGAGIIVMNVMVPGNVAYYAGLMLVFAAGYFFIRLRFLLATLAGWILCLLFNIGMLAFADVSVNKIITYNFFYVSANLIGMVAAYLMEINHRRNFFLMQQLDQKKAELEEVNEQLEEKVKHRTRELQASEKKYRNLVEEISDVIFLLNKDGYFEYISPVVEQLTGFKAEHYTGKPFSKLTYLAEHDLLADMLISEGSSDFKIQEFKVFTRNQQECWARSSTRCVIENGHVLGFRGILQNITIQKESEILLRNALVKAEAGDKLKTAFLNNISHEIRTPLNGILGFGQIIAQGNLTPQERLEYLGILEKSTERLTQTITNYMDISMIASGNLQANIKPFHIGSLMEEMFSELKAKATEKGIHAIFSLPSSINDLLIETDMELLKKCLRHFIDNAVRFTYQGQIETGYHIQNGLLEIFVRDTGIGIKPEDLDMIFKIFSQEDVSSSRKHDGSGLGLSIARGVALLLGGTIHVESKKGEGSTFRITLPLRNEVIEETVKESEHDIGQQAKVLVIANEGPNYLLIQAIVEKLYAGVLKASSSNDAVGLCIKHADIKLIIADSEFVENELFEVREIRKLRPELPLIAILRHPPDDERVKELVIESDDHVLKPLRKQVLYDKIKHFLKVKANT